MAQMKEQMKKELNEMEISKVLVAELKTPVITMLWEFSEDLSSIETSSQKQRSH